MQWSPARTEDLHAQLRPQLFGIAYRMVGTVADAEDIIQEAFLRLEATDEEVVAPRAWLSAVVTRLSIDVLRSSRRNREQYLGEWLPEPLPTSGEDPFEMVDSLSLAFLVLLERLSPTERAVLLLRDVFHVPFAEVAAVVARTEANCRQLLVRARRHVDDGRPRFAVSRQHREQLAAGFFAACHEGDLEALTDLLRAEVVLYGDGGGKAPAFPRPLHGRDRVSGVLVKLVGTARRLGLEMRPTEINGQPGAMFVDADDARLVNVVALDISEQGVTAVRSIVNPEKLGHLGPTADLKAILRGSGSRTPATPTEAER